jgi:SAM-dependent methyltransferase
LDRILDVGCGTADDLAYMPTDVSYVGFDLSARYIEAAEARWGDRGTFFQAEVSPSLLADQEFDVVVAHGVIHHLNDREALDLLKLAHTVLRPGGRLITKDPVLIEPQHPIARFLAKRDRGGHVRETSGYVQLAKQIFTSVSIDIRDDLLRLPYNHAVMVLQTSPRTSTTAGEPSGHQLPSFPCAAQSDW